MLHRFNNRLFAFCAFDMTDSSLQLPTTNIIFDPKYAALDPERLCLLRLFEYSRKISADFDGRVKQCQGYSTQLANLIEPVDSDMKKEKEEKDVDDNKDE